MKYLLPEGATSGVSCALTWIATDSARRLLPMLSRDGPTEFDDEEAVRAYERDLRNLGEASYRAARNFSESVVPVDIEPPPAPPPPDPPAPSGTVDPDELRAAVASNPPRRQVELGEFDDAPALFTAPEWANSVLQQGGSGAGGIQVSKKPRVHLRGSWIDCQGRHNWGAHVYGPIGLWEGNYIFGSPREHAKYNKNMWGGHWLHNVIENMRGQALQVVMRWPHEVVPAIPPESIYDPLGTGVPADWLVEQNALFDNAPPGERKSYFLSFFESSIDDPKRRPLPGRTLQDIRIVGNYMESVDHAESYGAIMVHGQNHVLLDSNVVRYKNPNRALVQVWGCASLTVVGGEYLNPDGGTVEFDIRGCPHVSFSGVGGNWVANVYGSDTEWYQFHHITPVASHSNTDFEMEVP